MDCALCHKPIRNYDPAFNRLEIDASQSADVCGECIDRFLKWQQRKYALLFPTKAAKKRFGRA